MSPNALELDYTNDANLNLSFFKWLLETDNVELFSEPDPVPLSEKTLIYYTKDLKIFFDTMPMQRLKRILQLGKFTDNNINALHTRYEHSLGVYNLKKNIIMGQYFNNPDFRNYVEENGLKLHLFAELIKSAGHDIGHLPLSHALESSVVGKPGFHEDIGKRILLENEQILDCLNNISPKLYDALKDTFNNDYFGFNLLDEGNYDVDRFDYLYRDLAFNGKPQYNNFEPFKLIKIKAQEDLKPKLDSLGKITHSSLYDENTIFVPVFDIKSLPSIEEFLNLRIQSYKDAYFHPMTEIRDKSLAIVLNMALKEKEPYGINLQLFLEYLKSIDSAQDVDLKEWLSWNDLNFYNELLDIAEFSSNSSLKKAAIFSSPSLEQVFDISAKMLNLKNRPNDFSNFDKNFLKRLHRYVNEKNDFTRDLADIDYWDKCIKFTSDPKKIKKLLSIPNLPIEHYSHKLIAYNPKKPIFIKANDGQIYEYKHLPNREPNVSDKPFEIEVAFCFIPFLEKFQEQSISNLDTELNGINSFAFGTPYLNRPSPSRMYIESAYLDKEER